MNILERKHLSWDVVSAVVDNNPSPHAVVGQFFGFRFTAHRRWSVLVVLYYSALVHSTPNHAGVQQALSLVPVIYDVLCGYA